MARQFTKSNNVVERTVRDNLILVPMKTGPARLDALYTLNTTSGFIWRQISSGTTEDELVAKLVAEYEVTEECARQDIGRILSELLVIGAITETGKV